MERETVEEFLSRGGEIKQIKKGERNYYSSLNYCKCGCEGDYTDHSMRAGESGRDSSVIIR